MDGNDVVAEAMDDFDRWEKMIGDDLADIAEIEWGVTPMLIKVYFYNRETGNVV